MAQRAWIGIASTALGLVVTGALTTPLWAAAPEVVPARAKPVTAPPAQAGAGGGAGGGSSPGRNDCATRSTLPDLPAQARSPKGDAAAGGVTGTNAVQQSVVVVVPPTAIVHLDAGGRVVSAMTNTGCAPTARDDLYLRMPGSTDLERAMWDTVAQHTWQGDFSLPGVHVPQSVD